MAESIIQAVAGEGWEQLEINGMLLERRLPRPGSRKDYCYIVTSSREQIDRLALPAFVPFPTAPKRITFFRDETEHAFLWAYTKALKGKRLRVDLALPEPLQSIELLFANAVYAPAVPSSAHRQRGHLRLVWSAA